MIAGSSGRRRSRANPSGSREQIMFRASLRFFPPVSSQPARPDDIGAGQDEQRAGHQFQPRGRVRAAAAQPQGRAGRPLLARAISTAGQPAFLPGPAGLFLQPVQQHRQPAPVVGVNPRLRQFRRRRRDQLQHLVAALPGGRPVRRDGPGREPGQRPPARRPRVRHCIAGRGDARPEGGRPGTRTIRGRFFPKSTSSVSGW